MRRRPLEGIEHSLTLSNEAAPFNVVCVLRLEGAPDPQGLRRAFAALQRRHLLLRARIVSEKNVRQFEFGDAAPVPLTVAERKSDDCWTAVAEDELNRRLDVGAIPLLRCVYLGNARDPGSKSELILTLNHAILDGSCLPSLFHDLLLAWAVENREMDGETVAEGDTPATALFPRRFSGVGFGVAVAGYMMRQMADEMAYRWTARGTRVPSVTDSGRNRILPTRLPAQLTGSLVRATRRERITMNAILSAALLLAVKRELYPSLDRPLRNITFADLRPYLRTRVPDEVLGCYMGMCRYTIPMTDGPDFWRLARKVQDAVHRSNRRGERFVANALSPAMMKMVLNQKSMRMGSTALSYAGPVSLGASAGGIRVVGLHAFTSNLPIGPEFSALARMFLGEIWLDFLYLDSDMGEEKALRMSNEVRNILESAAGEPGH